MSDDLTLGQIRERAARCQAKAREGADALHARAASLAKPTQLTNAESAAIARARLDQEEAR